MSQVDLWEWIKIKKVSGHGWENATVLLMGFDYHTWFKLIKYHRII